MLGIGLTAFSFQEVVSNALAESGTDLSSSSRACSLTLHYPPLVLFLFED